MGKKSFFGLLGACVILLSVDFFMKMYTYYHIAPMCFSSPIYPYGGMAIFKNWFGVDFSLNYVMNKGAAWGMFAQFPHLLLWSRCFVVVVLFLYLSIAKTTLSKRIALAFIMTGAVGNICDFFIYGHVIDMFHFRFGRYSFPVFNVADSVIFCGTAFLLIRGFFEKNTGESRKVY